MRKLLPDDDYNFTYDVRGNVTSVKNLHSQIDLAYQHFDGGDVIAQAHSYGIGNRTDLPNSNIGYNYNDAGEKIGMVTSKGTFQYGRDAAGRLRSITNHKILLCGHYNKLSAVLRRDDYLLVSIRNSLKIRG